MGNIWHSEFDSFSFSRPEGFRLFKTIPESSPEYIAAHQHLVSSHGIVLYRIAFRINIHTGKLTGIRKNINQFHNEVSVRRIDTAEQISCYRTSNRKILF